MRRAMLVIIPLVFVLTGSLHASFIERFSVDASYGFESWDAELDTLELFLTIGDASGEIPFTEEEIAWENEICNFYNRIHNFGLDLGFKVIKGLTINAGAGLAVIQLETREVYEEGVDTVVENLIDTKEPGFYLKVGLEFRLPIYRALFVAASPQVSYTMIRDMNLVDPDDDEVPEVYELLERSLNEDVLAWQGSLITGLDFGWINPYIGGRYQGFRQHVAHDQTFLEMTETDTTMIIHDEEMYFKPSFWAAGIAGLEFRIAEHLHLSLEGSMGQGFSVASKLKIGL
ncbi:hypothetical protein ES703_18452 [subsurface metagenome]